MVVNFEVGKKYRYNGKIGDPSPFLAIDIEEQDAFFIVSGEPLVCTYVENHSCPFIKFEGMSSISIQGNQSKNLHQRQFD